MSANHSFRYPELGDPKPRPNERVMLIKADKSHAPGYWTDDCRGWARLHADARRKPKQGKLPEAK